MLLIILYFVVGPHPHDLCLRGFAARLCVDRLSAFTTIRSQGPTFHTAPVAPHPTYPTYLPFLPHLPHLPHLTHSPHLPHLPHPPPRTSPYAFHFGLR